MKNGYLQTFVQYHINAFRKSGFLKVTSVVIVISQNCIFHLFEIQMLSKLHLQSCSIHFDQSIIEFETVMIIGSIHAS